MVRVCQKLCWKCLGNQNETGGGKKGVRKYSKGTTIHAKGVTQTEVTMSCLMFITNTTLKVECLGITQTTHWLHFAKNATKESIKKTKSKYIRRKIWFTQKIFIIFAQLFT